MHQFARVILCFALTVLGWSVAADASSSPQTASSPNECRQLQEDLSRLACYDRLFGKPALSTQAPAVAVPAPSTPTKSSDDQQAAAKTNTASANLDEKEFGVESLPSARERRARLKKITAILASISRRPKGHYVFNLDNGQVWTENESGRYYFKTDTTVTISRTRAGAYLLDAGKGRKTKVHRLR